MADHRGPDMLQVVASFCYLGDMLLAAGGCELSITIHVKTTWKKFKEMLPVLSSRHLSFNKWLRVQLLCAERNAPCQWDLAIDSQTSNICSNMTGQWSDRSAARHCHHTWEAWHWGCGSHSEGEKASLVWTRGMLQWYSQDSLWHTGWWKAWAWQAQDDMEAADKEGSYRVEALGYRHTWRSGMRSVMRAASQLPGRGSTDVDVVPVPALL